MRYKNASKIWIELVADSLIPWSNYAAGTVHSFIGVHNNAGVSNFNLLEGHTPEKKCSTGHKIYCKKNYRAVINKKNANDMLNFDQNSQFWPFLGWSRAACGPRVWDPWKNGYNLEKGG